MKRSSTLFCTLLLLIVSAVPAFASKVLADIEYFYADDGTLIGKAFNGKRVNFEYDLRSQLLAVKDAQGKDLERYTYDPAGNRLSKTINGVTTTYTYDKANQLVTSTVNGVTTHYKYDAAGRMIQAGDKTYIYNGQNKVSEVRQNGKTIARFEYNIDGQIAKAIYGNKVEEFMWDGLALIWRSGVTYINEPYVTGGNPVMAGDDVLFNDMLGSTLAINGKAVEMSSFGETADKNAFFTGKPMIDKLGYSFLFRDYNPNQGKWTTTDPLGYPDGWNNLAYCNNGTTAAIDLFGAWAAGVEYDKRKEDQNLVLLTRQLYFTSGNTPFSLSLLSKIINDTSATDATGVQIPDSIINKIKKDSALNVLDSEMRKIMDNLKNGESKTFNNYMLATTVLDDHPDVKLSIHGVAFYVTGTITKTANWEATLTVSISDPYDFNANDSNPAIAALGRLYDHGWLTKFSVKGSFSYTFKE